MHRPTIQRLAAALGFAVAANAHAATFTVTQTADTDIHNVGTLRWAIAQANDNPGGDTIAFAIGSGAQTITLNSALDMLADDLTQINGATQPGYAGTPLIRIDGSQLGANARGLYLRGDQIGINALSMTGFGGAAIFGDQYTADGVVVGCYLGLRQDGSTVGANGIGISMDGSGYYLGGTTAATRNVASGNLMFGIQIGANGTDNRVWGSYIGSDATGTIARPNGQAGIQIGGSGNVVGDVTANRRNVISGNSGAGVKLDGSANQVLGNYIGLGPDGLAALGNADGVLLYGDNNVVGAVAGGGNIISANTGKGIYARFLDGLTVVGNRIGTAADGAIKRGNGADGIYLEDVVNADIGGITSAHGNVISGNAGGIYASGASGVFRSNLIGLAADGTATIGNTGAGVVVYDSVLDIGTPGAGNTISGNGYYGLYLASGSLQVRGNRIGTNLAGNQAAPNADGIGLFEVIATVALNQISGNAGDGILISSEGAVAEITENRIGTDATGNAKIGNGGSGIRVVQAAPGLVIGAPNQGNQISGNYRGITLDDTTADIIAQGNNIGLNAAQNAKLGNEETAILMGGNNHQIGGIANGAGNIIAGNGSDAMSIGDGGGHHIEGNFIGTNSALASGLGNGAGIVNFTANDMIVGGTAVGAGNVITDNTWGGIRLEGGQNNAVLGNRVYDNAEYNIDIIPNVGPNLNDTLDVDQGPNKGQNYPEIVSATVNGMNLQFAGKLRSRANTQYRVEYFQTPACHSSGFGQGRSYIGHEVLMTNGAGEASLGFLGSNGQNSGFVTATATDPDGNTSEYGNCVAIGAPTAGEFNFMAYWQFSWEDFGVAEVFVTRSKGAVGAVSVQFSTANHAQVSAEAGLDYTATTTTLNFAAGETTKSVLVPILADALIEGMEDFDVKLSNATGGATLGALANARVAIYDHDPALIRARIEDAITAEPANGTVNAVFTVTMGADTAVRTIQYATEDGTATAGSDYVATSGTLTFQPGQTTKTISVPVKADVALEDDEYFQVVLSASDPGLQIERGIAIGAVLNSGGAPILFADGFD
jgi:parallel beta-helix repeat protein